MSEKSIEGRLDEWAKTWPSCSVTADAMQEAAAELRRLREENAKQAEEIGRLRAALKPFADYAECLPTVGAVERVTDDDGVALNTYSLGNNYNIRFGDLRRARAADRLRCADAEIARQAGKIRSVREMFDTTRHRVLKAMGVDDLGHGWFWVESTLSDLRRELAAETARRESAEALLRRAWDHDWYAVVDEHFARHEPKKETP